MTTETNTPNENVAETAPSPATSLKTNSHTVIQSLKEWGFQEAGLNQGNQHAFESRLRWIRDGHVVDSMYDENDEIKQLERIKKEIEGQEHELNSLEHREKHIRETEIPHKEAQIRAFNDDIDERKIRIKEGKVKSPFNPVRFWLYVSITAILSIFLVFFYASVINAAFFRNIQEILRNPETAMLKIDSPFDPDALFNGGSKLLFTYLGAFVFFGLGLIPHIIMQDKSKRAFWVWVAVVTSLLVDGLMAYKVDKSIHQLKTMMRMPDQDWFFLTSSNFYIVLVFGFGAYMLWGFLFEACIQEWQKRDMQANLQIEIEGIKRKIQELELQIIDLRKAINEMQQQIAGVKLRIEHLKNSLENTLLKPSTLLRNMENFYAGWLHFLNSTNSKAELLYSCDNIFKSFRNAVENPQKN